MGLLPICLIIDLRKLNFLSDIWTNIAQVNAMSSLYHLARWTDRDFNSLLAKFGLSMNSRRNTYKLSVYNYFQISIPVGYVEFWTVGIAMIAGAMLVYFIYFLLIFDLCYTFV